MFDPYAAYIGTLTAYGTQSEFSGRGLHVVADQYPAENVGANPKEHAPPCVSSHKQLPLRWKTLSERHGSDT
jgi:hypothetical protein